MTRRSTPAIALTIAGSDPSGGAGIQADLKTFAAFGVYGASVITALTAQNTRGVSGVHPVPVEFIAKQFADVIGDLTVAAIKTGMLGDAATVETVAAFLRSGPKVPIVVDPVMVATSGDRLLTDDAVAAMKTRLIPCATVITPNLHEAAVLLSAKVAATVDDMAGQARALLGLGCRAALVKGGHGTGDDAVDVLAIAGNGEHVFARPRVETRNTHGTGCTLAAAIAAALAQDMSLQEAIGTAKDFVTEALVSASSWSIGSGQGPVDHGVWCKRRDA